MKKSSAQQNIESLTIIAYHLEELIDNDQFIQALPGHLNYGLETESRQMIVLERIHLIIESGK